ncbi:MAG: papain-like cysteine peptidase [Paenibacillus sp.]|nr:papain-like cysteine peptidase [Paenibacillus sp.]
MNFNEIKGTYDVIFSLGQNCLAADQLSRHMLRNIGGVLDWVESPILAGVNQLLRNRFSNFMEFPNLAITGINDHAGCYIVRDAAYHIFSHHDFPLKENTPVELTSYPELRAKVARRVPRFLETLQNANRILFIRTEGTIHETAELLEVLKEMVTGEFNLLVINHAPVSGVIETPWPFPNVCALQIPVVPNEFHDNDYLWKNILEGFNVR